MDVLGAVLGFTALLLLSIIMYYNIAYVIKHTVIKHSLATIDKDFVLLKKINIVCFTFVVILFLIYYYPFIIYVFSKIF